MMKALFLTVATTLATFGASAGSTTYDFVGADSSDETRLCIAAVTNNMRSLKKELVKQRQRHEKTQNLVNNIQCNDKVIANFAYYYGATETVAYLDKYTRSRIKDRRSNITIKDLVASNPDDDTDKRIVVTVYSR